MNQHFGEFLILKKIIDPISLVQALNIQRRRGLIPLGEIALHDKLLPAEQLLNILDIQENTGRRFGDVALEYNYLTQNQLDILCRKQKQLHSHVGEILVEMNKISTASLDELLVEFNSSDEYTENCEELSIEDSDVEQFSFFDVACPICRESGTHKLIKRTLYEIEKLDIDLKPASCLWNVPIKDKCNPSLYEIWECPHCHFTMSHDEFHEPTRDMPPSLNNFRKKVVELYTNNTEINSIRSLLFNDTKDSNDCHSYISTIKRYLRAIHLYSKIPIICEQEGVQIAQLYLHLAWVYRDMNHYKPDSSDINKLKNIKLTIGDLWRSAPFTETAALEMALHYLDTAVYQSTSLLERGLEHKTLQLMGRIFIKLEKIKDARRLLLETIMNTNKQIAGKKQELKPNNNEFNKLHNKEIMSDLCRMTDFVEETKKLLEFCTTLKKENK